MTSVAELRKALQNLTDVLTRLIQRSRFVGRSPSEIMLLVAIADYVDSLDENTPDLTARVRFVSTQLSNLLGRNSDGPAGETD